jgi:MFS family permease
VVLSQALVVLSIGHVAGGAIYGGVSLCQVHMASVLAPRQGRTMAMAVHWSIVGLMAAIAPTLGGFFMDCCEAYPPGYRLPFGVPVAFIHALLVVHALMAWGLVAPTLTRILRRAGELPLGFVLARLGTGSPLRAVINAVNTPLALVVGAVQRLAGDDDEDERRAA